MILAACVQLDVLFFLNWDSLRNRKGANERSEEKESEHCTD
jgi:hypothetical protein